MTKYYIRINKIYYDASSCATFNGSVFKIGDQTVDEETFNSFISDRKNGKIIKVKYRIDYKVVLYLLFSIFIGEFIISKLFFNEYWLYSLGVGFWCTVPFIILIISIWVKEYL